jgi:hypothetical protein
VPQAADVPHAAEVPQAAEVPHAADVPHAAEVPHAADVPHAAEVEPRLGVNTVDPHTLVRLHAELSHSDDESFWTIADCVCGL